MPKTVQWEPTTTTQERIIKWRRKGWSYIEIADKVEVSVSYVYQILRKAGLVRKQKRLHRRK